MIIDPPNVPVMFARRAQQRKNRSHRRIEWC